MAFSYMQLLKTWKRTTIGIYFYPCHNTSSKRTVVFQRKVVGEKMNECDSAVIKMIIHHNMNLFISCSEVLHEPNVNTVSLTFFTTCQLSPVGLHYVHTCYLGFGIHA